MFSGSLLLFLTNAVTIALTAALVARVYGFGSHLSPHHTGWQLVLFVGALGILSVPLGTALKQIAFEAVAQRQVRDTVRAHFPAGARLSQLEIDYTTDPIQIRAVMLTPRVDRQADRTLTTALASRLSRAVDIHVDQLRISLDTGAAEAAQIAQAAETAARPSSIGHAKAVAELALISGAEPATIGTDMVSRTLHVRAAPLPSLELEGYRALEQRAARALPGWNIQLMPPGDLALPEVPIEQGVVDGVALDLAAWSSARLDRAVEVRGGTSAQREAIAQGILARGGSAEAVAAPGPPRLEWRSEEDSAQ